MRDRITMEGLPRGEIPGALTGDKVPVKGAFEGRTVEVVEDALSLIADAAEELTFEAAETVEKKVEERRVEKERPSDLIRRIQQCVSLMPDLDRKKLQRWIQQIRQNPPRSSHELMRSLREVFGDISHQHLALGVLEEFSGDEPTLQRLAHEAKETLTSEAAPSIRAGLNTSTVAQEYAEKGLGHPQELRDFYRETILHYEGITETFQGLQHRFPDTSLPEAIAYLIHAVGSDLHARGPSLDTEELRAILNDLYQLESLATLYQSCDQLLRKVSQGFHLNPALGPRELVGEIIALKDKQWLSENDILGLVTRTGVQEPSVRIYFLQGLLGVLRHASLKLFPSDETRAFLITKTQEALDRCIEEEP